MNKYDKTYFELCAGLILNEIKLFGKDFNIKYKLEQPDLQVNDVGVEVTLDYTTTYGKRRSTVDEISELPFSEQVNQLQNNKKHKGVKDLLIGNKEDYSYNLELIDRDEYYSRIINAIKRKDGKYNIYTRFNTMALFIFGSFYYNFLELQNYLSVVNTKFDIIFIMSFNGILYKWDGNILTEFDMSIKNDDIIKQAHDLRRKYSFLV